MLDLSLSSALSKTAVHEAFQTKVFYLHPAKNTACLKRASAEFVAARRARDTLMALAEVAPPSMYAPPDDEDSDLIVISGAVLDPATTPSPATSPISMVRAPMKTKPAEEDVTHETARTAPVRPIFARIKQRRRRQGVSARQTGRALVADNPVSFLRVLGGWIKRTLLGDWLHHTFSADPASGSQGWCAWARQRIHFTIQASVGMLRFCLHQLLSYSTELLFILSVVAIHAASAAK